MDESQVFYVIRFFAGSVAHLLMAFIVLGVRIPAGTEFRRERTAKYMLSAALAMLGLPVFFYSILSVSPPLLFVVYLIDSIAYFCIAVSMMLLSHAAVMRMLPWIVAVIALFQALFVVMFPVFGISEPALGKSLGAFSVLAAVFMTVAFVRSCLAAGGRGALRWVVYLTVLMTVTCFYQILLVIFPGLDSGVVYVKVIFALANGVAVMFLYDHASSLRYRAAGGLSCVPAAAEGTSGHGDGLTADCEELLRRSLEEWVAGKRFLEQDEGTDVVASQLGTDLKTLRLYFRTRMPSDFRTWRISLRIEYAKEMLRSDPDVSMNKLSEMAGFATKGNFYNYFKKITGMTPLEYKNSCRGSLD